MRPFFLGLFVGLSFAIGWTFAAPEFFIEGSQYRYGNVGDGTFQQTDLHTDNYLRPIGLAIGIADKWSGSDRLGWRIALRDSGKIRVRDNESVNDEQAHNHSAGPCTPPQEVGCTLRFNGEGRTFGASFGLTYEHRLPLPGASLTPEVGLFFFQHHFKAEGRFIDCPNTCRLIAFNETSKLWDMPSPYLGAMLRWHSVYVAARHYWPSGHRPQSIWNVGEMNELVVGLVRSL